MSNLFESLSWNGEATENTFLMDKNFILSGIESAGETVVKLLEGIKSIPEGLIIPVFVVSGIETFIQYGISQKEPSFSEISPIELDEITTKLYHILDSYVVQHSKQYFEDLDITEKDYPELVAFNERYLNEVFAKYDVAGYANISAGVIASGFDTFTIKSYLIGLVNYLRKTGKSEELQSYLGTDETNQSEVHSFVRELFGLKFEEDLLPISFTADDLYNIFNW